MLFDQWDEVKGALQEPRHDVLIPMIRRILPAQTMEDILRVQPMQAPAGLIFSMRHIGGLLMFNSFVKENFAMMNIRQRSVNVDRRELLVKLKENRDIHKREYEEALVECQQKLAADLESTLKTVQKVKDPRKLKNFRFNFQFPQNHTREYDDVIEMLEMSQDQLINLDSESFKAYIKNEWAWTHQFNSSKALYASAGSAFSNIESAIGGGADDEDEY